MRTVLATAITLVLSSAAIAEDAFTVRYNSFGPVLVGMTKNDVSRALGRQIERVPGAGDVGCEYYHVVDHLKGVEFMFSRGHVARIDVTEGTTATESGVHIGDSISKIKKVYGGKVSIAPHKYIPEPEGKYVTVKSPNGKHAIRFETDNGRIVTYYAGRFPEVTYVEGCL